MDPSRLHDDRDVTKATHHVVAAVTGDAGGGQPDLSEVQTASIFKAVFQSGQPGPQDDPHARGRRREIGQRGRDAIREMPGRRHKSMPATVAVMNAAIVPPIIARSPRRERSWRRDGAIPPIPAIWTAIEPKFAKPDSA